MGTSNRVGKPKLHGQSAGGSVWTALGVKTNRQFVSVFFSFFLGGCPVGRDAPHFVSCTSRSCTRFHSEDGRKNALVPPAGGGNLTIVQPVSQLLDSYPNLTDLGEGKYLTPALTFHMEEGPCPTPATLYYPGSGVGRGVACGPDNEKHVWNSQPGGLRLTENCPTNHGTREYVPYTWPPHH